MASQTSMQFDVPTASVITKAIEQPIKYIELTGTLKNIVLTYLKNTYRNH